KNNENKAFLFQFSISINSRFNLYWPTIFSNGNDVLGFSNETNAIDRKKLGTCI
ncbi:hypothetical protein GIB67_000577, partial [Kingdonia uniflora]